MRRKSKERNGYRPTVVDLFCGAGGLSEGFHSAGYRVLAGLDLHAPSMESWTNRFAQRGGMALHKRIEEVRGPSLEALKERLPVGLDVLVGGPSCQGYSTSGGLSKNRGRDLYDPRNSLFAEFLRLVDALEPNWVLFENVPGLLLYHHGEVARTIDGLFADRGYRLRPMILLAADFGVPQLRRRLFFVGNRTGSRISFPAPTHGDAQLWRKFALPFAFLSRIGHKRPSAARGHVTFDEACGDLPELAEGESIDDVPYPGEPSSAYQTMIRVGSDSVRQHAAFPLSASDRVAAVHLRPGQNWRSLPDDLRPPRFRNIRRYDATTLMKRLDSERPAYTITTKFHEASTGAFIHPSQPRTLSIREAARLQSFPDTYVFAGSGPQIRTQIGNAVPPLLARALAEAILPQVATDRGRTVSPCRETIDVDDLEVADLIGLHGARKRVKQHVAADR